MTKRKETVMTEGVSVAKIAQKMNLKIFTEELNLKEHIDMRNLCLFCSF